MGIGGGIFLIVVGAILSFAVTTTVNGIDLVMVGYICMAAGALAVILSLISGQQRSRTSHREVIERREGPSRPTRTTREEYVQDERQDPYGR